MVKTGIKPVLKGKKSISKYPKLQKKPKKTNPSVT